MRTPEKDGARGTANWRVSAVPRAFETRRMGDSVLEVSTLSREGRVKDPVARVKIA